MHMYAEHNLYPGINAHLNSYLQQEAGGWENFHAEHIIDLGRSLDAALPAGYFVRSEKTLQIRESVDFGTRSHRTTPDITVFGTSAAQANPVSLFAEPSVRTIPLLETLSEEDLLTGLVVYQADEQGGKPITRIELLSPANKPSGAHHEQYLVKRKQTLQSGLRMVEIDYLHLSPPITDAIPSYADGDAQAYPYLILVSDPRPTLMQGITQVYEIGIVDALPTVMIPLAEKDVAPLDLQKAYTQTFGGTRFFRSVVDYTTLPMKFNKLRLDDQVRLQSFLGNLRVS
jgi:Protein of unknown function (DUF4058)